MDGSGTLDATEMKLLAADRERARLVEQLAYLKNEVTNQARSGRRPPPVQTAVTHAPAQRPESPFRSGFVNLDLDLDFEFGFQVEGGGVATVALSEPCRCHRLFYGVC